jgi:hypothetical protein
MKPREQISANRIGDNEVDKKYSKSRYNMMIEEGVGSCALPITQTLCAVCW